MQKLTLTGRSLWWPFPCRVCGTSPRAPSPRGSPWGRPRPRPPPGDGGAREGGGGLRGGGAAPEGVARCAASPGAREAWAASSPVHQDRLDDDGATLPPLPPGRLLPRACADPSLNLQRYRISCTERDLANLGQIGIYRRDWFSAFRLIIGIKGNRGGLKRTQLEMPWLLFILSRGPLNNSGTINFIFLAGRRCKSITIHGASVGFDNAHLRFPRMFN